LQRHGTHTDQQSHSADGHKGCACALQQDEEETGEAKRPGAAICSILLRRRSDTSCWSMASSSRSSNPISSEQKRAKGLTRSRFGLTGQSFDPPSPTEMFKDRLPNEIEHIHQSPEEGALARG
jgi:hypothetical protein